MGSDREAVGANRPLGCVDSVCFISHKMILPFLSGHEVLRGNSCFLNSSKEGFEKSSGCEMRLYCLQKLVNIMWPSHLSGD